MWGAIVFALAMVARIGASVAVPAQFGFFDEEEYFEWATGLLAGKELTLFKPPGYAVFVAGAFVLFGHSIQAVRAAQALVGGACAVLLYAIGRRLFGHWPGVLAGAVFGIYPMAIYLAVVMYPQCLISLFLYAAVYGGLLATDSPSVGKAAIIGVIVGLGSLCVPAIIPVLAAIGVWVLVAARHRPLAVRLRFVAIAAVFVLLSVAPWTIHLWQRTGRFVPIATIGSHALWVQNNPDAKVGHATQVRPTSGPLYDKLQSLDRVDEARLLQREALRYIIGHPWRYVRLCAGRLAFMFRPYPTPVTRTRYATGPYKWVAAVTYTPLALFSAVGLYLGRKQPLGWLVALVIAFYAIGYAAVSTLVRYRLPVDGLLGVFAAYAWCRLSGALIGAGSRVQQRVTRAARR